MHPQHQCVRAVESFDLSFVLDYRKITPYRGSSMKMLVRKRGKALVQVYAWAVAYSKARAKERKVKKKAVK